MWFEEKWGVYFYLYLYVFIISVVILLRLLKVISPPLFYSLIGPIIAIGPPTINYLYKERLKRPNIVFGEELEYTVAPLQSKLNQKAKTVNPTVYFRLEVKNKGRVTAKNCMANVNVREDGSHIARWAVPENPERYDLLPGEARTIHIFKSVLLPKFLNVVYNIQTGEFVHHGKGSVVGLKSGTPKPLEAIRWDIISPSVQRPRKIPPESRGESSFGGWLDQKVDSDTCSVTVQAIAEDYKSEKKEDFDTLELTKKSVLVAATEENWQNQWGNENKEGFFDRSAALKKRFITACQKRLDKLDEYPL